MLVVERRLGLFELLELILGVRQHVCPARILRPLVGLDHLPEVLLVRREELDAILVRQPLEIAGRVAPARLAVLLLVAPERGVEPRDVEAVVLVLVRGLPFKPGKRGAVELVRALGLGLDLDIDREVPRLIEHVRYERVDRIDADRRPFEREVVRLLGRDVDAVGRVLLQVFGRRLLPGDDPLDVEIRNRECVLDVVRLEVELRLLSDVVQATAVDDRALHRLVVERLVTLARLGLRHPELRVRLVGLDGVDRVLQGLQVELVAALTLAFARAQLRKDLLLLAALVDLAQLRDELGVNRVRRRLAVPGSVDLFHPRQEVFAVRLRHAVGEARLSLRQPAATALRRRFRKVLGPLLGAVDVLQELLLQPKDDPLAVRTDL